MAVINNISIEQYLEIIARFSDNEYGKMVRDQFKDINGSSELGMLAAPSAEELQQLKNMAELGR